MLLVLNDVFVFDIVASASTGCEQIISPKNKDAHQGREFKGMMFLKMVDSSCNLFLNKIVGHNVESVGCNLSASQDTVDMVLQYSCITKLYIITHNVRLCDL